MSTTKRDRAPHDQTVKTLSVRSDVKGLARLSIHLALIAATSTAIWATRGTWASPLAMLAQGLTLVAAFAIIHETAHRTAFASRRLNDAVGWLAGLPSALNATAYRHFHNAHHRHVQDPERDPELTPPPPATRGAFWLRMTGMPYWRGRVVQLWRLARGDFTGAHYVPARERAGVVASVRLMLGVYVGVLGSAAALADPWPLLYWIGPVILGQPFLRAYLLCEHTGLPHTDNGHENTRTTLAAWPIRLLMWNMPYHAEHHLHPGVPFHALPDLHRHLDGRIEAVADGYWPTLRAIHRALPARGAA